MTTTTKTTDWAMTDLADDDFEAFADWMAARTPRAPVGRDALGRFCRMVHRHAVAVWVNDNRMSHSHARCGTLVKATRAGVVPTMTVTPTGFLCGACVHVDMPVALASAHVPPRRGTATCDRCDTVKPITKFPTVWLHGFIADRGTVCRDCCQPWRNRPVAVGGGPVLAW